LFLSFNKGTRNPDVCVILDERFKPLKRISFDCATFGTRFNTPVFIFFVVAEIVLSFVSFSSREYFVSSPPEEEEDEEDESEATLNGVVVFRRFLQKVPLLFLLLVVVVKVVKVVVADERIFPPPLERHKQQQTLAVFVKVAENDALIVEENVRARARVVLMNE
jgi:hypothetical protein